MKKLRIDSNFPTHLYNLFCDSNPFASKQFYQSLVGSDALSSQTGQTPLFFETDHAYTLGLIKTHSYGEFIFDWAWANAYQRLGLNYYPKLIHYTPFTPVNAPKIYSHGMDQAKELINLVKNHYLAQEELSSHHYLFINIDEQKNLKEAGYLIRNSMQYHWKNSWESFDHFLDSLLKRKKKMIMKERRKVLEHGLEISTNNFQDLNDNEVLKVFKLYQSTVVKKNSYLYLNLQTFMLWRKCKEAKIVLARKIEDIIAMAIFFQGPKTLYGRYWGIDPKFNLPMLHFELCYYQGMEICFKHNLELFEAGAQGEQKLKRGFAPVIIKSAHHLRNFKMFEAVENFINEEKEFIDDQIKIALNLLPYRAIEPIS